jgi:hypothetical protein
MVKGRPGEKMPRSRRFFSFDRQVANVEIRIEFETRRVLHEMSVCEIHNRHCPDCKLWLNMGSTLDFSSGIYHVAQSQ